MLFRDLYAKIDALPRPPVAFDFIKDLVVKRHLGVGTVKVWAVRYPTPTDQAHYRMIDMDRTSAYDEEFGDVEITYCEGLDRQPLERRYALTKELMHVFDRQDQRTDSREKFIQLIREIQNKPIKTASAAFSSELDTRWMAAIALCPKRFRDEFVAEYRDGTKKDFDLSEIFRVPEWVIPFVMDDYYNEAFDLVIAA